jgi:hypothetical protein
MRRALVTMVGFTCGILPQAARADRAPIAVLWLGDAASLTQGAQVADGVNAALGRSPTARQIDGGDDRRALIAGGPATQAAQLQARAESEFVQLKYADAARDYETAEQLLLEDVPLVVTQRRLAAVERNLLVCYDQLGRADDAARAAERLGWTAGTNDDVAALLAKYRRPRTYTPAYAPVQIVSEPPGVAIYRDLAPAGATPMAIAGGDDWVDAIDLDLPGYRRVHQPLGHAQAEVRVVMQREERLSALVDEARALAPDAPPGLVAAIGSRVGATRVLVIAPDGDKVLARWLDVRKQRWADAPMRSDAAGGPAMEKLAAYAAPEAAKPPAAVAAAMPLPQPEPEKKSRWGAWGKWYTWVAAGAVVALVAGLLIAEHVGSDSLSIEAIHKSGASQ